VISRINDIAALSFMSLFPEMKEDEFWHEICQWVGSGKMTPMLNLGVFCNDKLVGLFPCESYPDRLMIHACFIPEFRGSFAVDSAKQAFQWVWDNTKYNKISAYIEPEHVKRFATRCGMIEKNGLFEVTR
jgi:RimJ/RimL family protein N-acetyltransferase